MASSPFIFPTIGVLSGLELVSNLNTALQLLATNNASSTEPADPFLYQLWYNTATGQLTQWNGTEWVPTTFGSPLSSVNIISGGMTVTEENFSTVLEAQGTDAYSIALPAPSDYFGKNVVVFNNLTGGNNVTITTAGGSFVGLGVTGSSISLPPEFFALFVSDGYNWIVNSALGNALLNGSSNQVFNVANASNSSNAVPLGQAQALFAAVNGNTANAFAVANAPSENYAINLGQANSLYAQLEQANTFEETQNFASGMTTIAGAGGVSAGTLPSESNGFIQASFPSSFSGFFEQYYKNGVLVYSLDSSGNITANSLTTPTLNVTGMATVPIASTSYSAVPLQQLMNNSINAAFSSVQATGTISGGTVSGGTVSGGTVSGGTGVFTNLVVSGTATVQPATEPNQALQASQLPAVYSTYGDPSGVTSASISLSFTPEYDGTVIVLPSASLGSGADFSGSSVTATGATFVNGIANVGNGTPIITGSAIYSVTAGTAATFDFSASTASATTFYITITAIFIPSV